ncbi:MAG: hypothetical protein H6706_02675 [Myxococcales bacterium]|nr:hypothetical protein [Myxococcales bacterium]
MIKRFGALASVLALALAGCGEKELSAGGPDAGPVVDASAGGAGGEGGGAGGAGGGGEAPPQTPYPGGCAADTDCDQATGYRCRLGVCVAPPGVAQQLAYSCQDMPRPQSRPSLGCFDAPPPLAEGPAEVAARGKVEYFGDGNQTVGLTVRFYRYKDFDPSPCVDVAGREPDVAARRALTEACVDGLGAPIAETVTVECDVPDPESGCYTVPALPTGERLVVRITGDLDEWVPTYHYGVLINPCTVPVVRAESGACPEDFPEASDADWACDLTADAGGDYYLRNLSVISQATWTSFPPTAGLPRINLGNGAVAGRFFDCEGRSVINATFALAHPGAVRTFFNGNPDDLLPQPGLTYTNTRGTYASLDTPPGPNGLVAVGRRGSDDVLTVAYERFFLLPDTITLLNPTGRRPLEEEPPF